MKGAIPASALLTIAFATGCARTNARPESLGIPSGRVIPIGDGITVRSGPVLTSLPSGQRYRFVPPESLATGLSADDASSAEEPALAGLRAAFATVMARAGWVESADSAEFDVTIFRAARLRMRRESRERLSANVTTCGDVPTTQLQLCTDDPLLHTEQWSTEHTTFHVLRRRSDGAVRVWRRYGPQRP